jgi:hypothetical protein
MLHVVGLCWFPRPQKPSSRSCALSRSMGIAFMERFVESAVERDVVGDDGADADGLPQVSAQRGQTDLLR